jgi:hypothetical protein
MILKTKRLFQGFWELPLKSKNNNPEKIGANTEIGGENFGQDSFEKKIID